MDLLEPSEELDGKVTMMATDRWLLLPAQKALGFSANTTDPEELEQVTELLIEAKDHLLAYDDTTFYSRLVSGEAGSSRRGTAGATTASPRIRTSSSSSPRRAATSSSTRW